MEKINSRWIVYMVCCRDGSLYTGVTTQLDRRLREHNESKTAAAYTRSRRPVKLVYRQRCKDRSAALKREMEIKRLDRPAKQKLIRRPPQKSRSRR